jgi:hypothetical protein
LGGKLHQLEPDDVLGELVQRPVAQPGVFQRADAVLGPSPLAVPQLQLGQPPTLVLVANRVIRSRRGRSAAAARRGAGLRLIATEARAQAKTVGSGHGSVDVLAMIASRRWKDQHRAPEYPKEFRRDIVRMPVKVIKVP